MPNTSSTPEGPIARVVPNNVTSPNGLRRLSAAVDGQELFFEADVDFAGGGGDVIATALFLSALSRNVQLHIDATVDQTLLNNLDKVATIARRWWGMPPGEIRAPSVVRRHANEKTGMFFTGGVDSFLTLRQLQEQVSGLISVHGFDISLHDQRRFDEAKRNVSAIADELGLIAIYPRTNLRTLTFFDGNPPWGVSHLAALSAIAHLLGNQFSKVYVASSDVPPPWGSHPKLDRLWSSSAVTIENHGWRLTRLQKVMQIADWTLVHKYLKVCWENRSESLNCGECEKCVRTQAQFSVTKYFSHVQTFPPGDLAERIASLHHGEFPNQWMEIMQTTTSAKVRAAIAGLLARSAKTPDAKDAYWSWSDDARFLTSDLLRCLPGPTAASLAKRVLRSGGA
jgi:hypothetical protein